MNMVPAKHPLAFRLVVPTLHLHPINLSKGNLLNGKMGHLSPHRNVFSSDYLLMKPKPESRAKPTNPDTWYTQFPGDPYVTKYQEVTFVDLTIDEGEEPDLAVMEVGF